MASRDTLEQVYREHRQGLYTLALSVTKDPALAEDAVHEAICGMMDKEMEQPVAYAYRSVRNRSIDMLRKRRRESPEVSFYAETHDNPGTNMVEQERHGQLKKAVEQLPDKQRQVIILKIYADLTFDQIGQALEESINTVSSRYRRGLIKLKEIMEQQAA